MSDEGEGGRNDDPSRQFAFKVWNYKQGEAVSLMIHLGDRLGLYRAMAGAGTLRASELADRTGLDERWLLEWLRSQAAADLLHSADGVSFQLPTEAVPVLVDEDESLWFAAGAFTGGVALDVVDRLADAFRTGIGLTFDDLGPTAVHRVERSTGPWSRLALVPRILPALEGVVDRLESGGRVADVGCGAGVAVLAMAEAFPESRFEGYDPSGRAIERARQKVEHSGLENVEFHRAHAADLPVEPTYDLVLALDCVHDMPRPAEAISSIRRAISHDGVLLIKDIRSAPTWEENLRNPMLALMYATSVTMCMSSALSEHGGAGLGTLGFDRERAAGMCEAAGFRQFRVHDFDDPVNLYYEVRP